VPEDGSAPRATMWKPLVARSCYFGIAGDVAAKATV